MKLDWMAQSIDGQWAAIPRAEENPTMRDRIMAADDLREMAGFGWDMLWGDEGFIKIVRDTYPTMVTYYSGEVALEESEGEYEEMWFENPNGSIMAWVWKPGGRDE